MAAVTEEGMRTAEAMPVVTAADITPVGDIGVGVKRVRPMAAEPFITVLWQTRAQPAAVPPHSARDLP